MPKDFLECIKNGGKVVTIKIGENKTNVFNYFSIKSNKNHF